MSKILRLSYALVSGIYVFAPVLAAEQAKNTGSEKSADGQNKMAVVEVKESYDARRDDTATKHVVRSEELQKYGDSSILDSLRRVPGVTVSGGGAVSMRGLSSRYTQILVNGDRPAPGFSLAAIPPDQVERIEIFRSATAEHSMQAIAGTINIVLRRRITNTSRSVKLQTSQSAEGSSYNTSGAIGGKYKDFSYFIDTSYSRSNTDLIGSSEDRSLGSEDAADGDRLSRSRSVGRWHALTLMPRFTWTPSASKEIVAQFMYQSQSNSSTSKTKRDVLFGSFPEDKWRNYYYSGKSETSVWAGSLEWTQDIFDGKLVGKVSYSENTKSGDDKSVLDQDTAAQVTRTTDSKDNAVRVSLLAKYEKKVNENHLISLGAESITQNSDERRNRIDVSEENVATFNLENSEDKVTTDSLFFQDEWKADERLSIYGGVRWERIVTSSFSQPGDYVRSSNSIITPVAQTLYKLANRKGEQIRAALTRTFRAPSLDELTAQRSFALANSRFSPDHSGNPNLQPETVRGLDLTFEKYGSGNAFMTVSTGFRRIDNHISTQLSLGVDGRWIYRPQNSGKVNVRNLETDFRLPGALFDPHLKAANFRFTLNRNWSRLVYLSAPDNVLPSSPLNLTLGVDYKAGPISTGANIVYRRGYLATVSDMERRGENSRTTTDLYALWRQSAGLRWRLSINNLFPNERTSFKSYSTVRGTSLQRQSDPEKTKIGLNLEIKF